MLNNAEGLDSVDQNRKTVLQRALRVDWLGQTAASLFWVTSVIVYGISGPGDWLQLGAASAWLLANIAALVWEESG